VGDGEEVKVSVTVNVKDGEGVILGNSVAVFSACPKAQADRKTVNIINNETANLHFISHSLSLVNINQW
jgi:GTP cyclohydrolase FolE2